MSKPKNRANVPQISIAQPNSMPASASSTMQAKTAAVQPALHDIPNHDPAAAAQPTHDEIAVRAYEIFVEEGCPKGQSDEIWRRAELEKTA